MRPSIKSLNLGLGLVKVGTGQIFGFREYPGFANVSLENRARILLSR